MTDLYHLRANHSAGASENRELFTNFSWLLKLATLRRRRIHSVISGSLWFVSQCYNTGDCFNWSVLDKATLLITELYER